MKEEIYRTFLDPIIQVLGKLLDELGYDINFKMPIDTMRSELRFLKMFFWGLLYWDIELNYDWHLLSAINVMFPKLSQTTKEFVRDFEHVDSHDQWINWEELSYDLEKMIKELKVQAKEICIHLLNGGFKCKSCQPNQFKPFDIYARDTVFFIIFVEQNLEHLLISNIELLDLARRHFGFIQWKLEEFGYFDNPMDHSVTRVKNLGELISCTRTWFNQISCLAFLYWIDGDGVNQRQAFALETLLSDVTHKTKCYTPGVIASNIQHTVVPQLLASYIDFHLKILVEQAIIFEIETLREGLMFLLSLFLHPPQVNPMDKELIMARTYAIINELPTLFRSMSRSDEMKEGICKDMILGYLQKIDAIKANVGDMHVISTPDSSNFSSPRTNPIGFLDSLLETLEKVSKSEVSNLTPFAKNQVETVREDLASIRPFLQNKIDLFENDQHWELIKDLWIRTVDTVYYASYITNLCSSGTMFPLWYSILGIELIKTHIKNIEDHQVHKNKSFTSETKPNIALSPAATTSKIEGAFIGFQEDVVTIKDYLLRGKKVLTIISISGMPGQGKTTLAKKIFNDPSVQHHFHKKVWSYVSKECTLRELLLKIVREVTDEEKYKSLLKEPDSDLADYLRKILKGQRYLIVMDDIWDVEVWHQVEVSFPNDGNGSRILFTSRNHDLASQAQSNSISYHLRLLSDEESWELMKVNLFNSHSCPPPELLEIGKRISIYCKGLPLAVSLIAAVLMRIEPKVDLWIQIAETLKSHLASEGCRNIIELSYKNLPDDLKPCFLYFGAFPRGENVLAKKLKLLWIAEGFINNKDDNKMQYSSEDLANGYLTELVSQSLVVVTEKSSNGGIKRCNVHDLLYDLCLEKAVEDNFLLWTEETTAIDRCHSRSQKFNHHRICIGKTDPLINAQPIITRNELLTSRVHSLLWFSHLGKYSFISMHIDFPWFLESFKLLKLLDLEGVLLGFGNSTERIMQNIHLRYLELRCSGEMGLPLSMVNLWNLETLILNAERVISIPLSIWTMKSLRHVDIQFFRFDCEDFDDQGENIISSFAAHDIEKLSAIFLAYNTTTEKFLEKLQKLRKFRCYVDGSELDPMWFSMLKSLTKLESLHVDAAYNKPSTINFPRIDNLKKLTLSGGQLPWSMLSEIGKQLPNLEILKLLSYSFSGTSWDLEDDEFLKLRYLKLEFLEIEEINFSFCDDPFPCLEELVVSNCNRLKEIPSNFGDIYTLNIVKVLGLCSKISKLSVQRVAEKQLDIQNDNFRAIVEIYRVEEDDGEEEE